jgi:glutathione S-transferase
MSYTLVIANKNYSSWSLRPWLAMKVAGIPFEEIVIVLKQEDTQTRIREHSPAGKVPILKTETETIWDSLAILETLAERHPDARLWPADPVARAHARSISAEMHSGFAPLRNHYGMNVRRKIDHLAPTPEVDKDIARIEQLWADTRRDFGQGGPFLFGAFSIADAMYAPVVWRFEGYTVPVSETSRAYMDAMLALPAMREWAEASKAETAVIPAYEV